MRFVYSDTASPYISDSKEFSVAVEVMAELGTENCFIEEFDKELVDYASYNSFFPMAGLIETDWVLLLKLHKERCIVDFEQFRVSKKIKKLSLKYKLTFNQEFKTCVDMINKRYEDSWFSEEFVAMMEEMRKSGAYKIKFCSFELWDENEIVAGELGFVIGGVYSSLSGFHNVSNTGHVQLYLTNNFLKDNGFSFWDLGMELDYKIHMGGKVLTTDEFYERYAKVRDKNIIDNLECKTKN